MGSLRENLFCLVHDAASHFGADKCYATLQKDYYWPNMHRDLEDTYIPSCAECQWNKSATTRLTGLLHPLPVPEERGASVAINFIGPLPLDDGFDCIVSMTDRLGGSDVRVVPTKMKMTGEEFAVIFFNHWYCENGLPGEIVLDHDKIFTATFWRALNALTGMKLRMSSSFHPKTDGASEQTNKTINQAIRYHVHRNQKGWVRALPKIRFNIMNTINASTGFSGFKLRLGRSPHMIPPIVPSEIPWELQGPDAREAMRMIERIALDVEEAKDNLLLAKVVQAFHANKGHGKDDIFMVGDKVMLATLNRRREYVRKGEK